MNDKVKEFNAIAYAPNTDTDGNDLLTGMILPFPFPTSSDPVNF